MKSTLHPQHPLARSLSCLALAAMFALPLPALAASVALSTVPLSSSTTSTVKPNVMFILDDSGSMSWDYLPDWANDTDPFTGTSYINESALHKNTRFNGVAYNPAITYLKPVFYNSDGSLNTTTYPNFGSPWTAVKRDGYGIESTSTDNLVGNASFYTFTVGEHCSTPSQTSCVTTATPTVANPYPAYVRWCDSAALTTCQIINDSTYKYPRYSGRVTPATATVRVTSSTSSNTVTQITVNGQKIMSGAASGSSTESTTASRVVTKINDCTNAITGSCDVAGYSATRSSTTITISAPNSMGAITFTPVKSGGASTTITAFSGYGAIPGSNILTNIVSTNNSYPYPGTTTKATTRSDCAGTTCTYAEEMTNYANWWAYYHTRIQAMKTSVSRAFKTIDNRFRVGFTTIGNTGATNGTTFLGNDTFELAHKNSWFTKLFAATTPGATPLRGALSKAGRYYAKKVTGQTVDPVQYSCQQNFTILSTDGYWNTNDETSSYKALSLTGGLISALAAPANNPDSATNAVRPMREGTTAVTDTLADIAKYYYDTDLRSSALGNCSGGISTDYPLGNTDVCTDNVFVSGTDNNTKQHMTTFTMGLGIDGTLNFTTDYQTATSGDYYDLKNGLNSKDWPNPIDNSGAERIDDLWHAAVNGQGVYFSAKDPDSIIAGFNAALASITAKLGSGAAAATSTLNPVAGDNFAYVASYTTVKWVGNLEARTINTTTGVVSESATWCAENVIAGTCISPSSVVADTSGGSTIYNCVTPGATLATCGAPGVLDGTDCKVELQVSCAGTMAAQIGTTTDTRTIYMKSATNTLVPFVIGNLNAADFSSTGLSQYGLFSAAQIANATPTNLVNFLRGQTGYEDRSTNIADKRIYRLREAVLGDAVESQPAFVGTPTFSYTENDYASFKSSQSGRTKVVYMGANDGMLHCFNATTGVELWAYVPSVVIPNLKKLADANYATGHAYFANGSPIVSDVYSGGAWRTILVAGLNGGGRGHYPLDITIPASPTLLWEFSSANDNDLGYTFGHPVITKKSDGTWVTLVTSGYNNTSPGDGKGYLYVLNAMTGAVINKIGTGVGDTATPSGLSRVSSWADDPEKNNAATFTYGGDLLGNLWRFDINTAAAPLLFATLKDSSGVAQPITVAPELGKVDGKRVVYIGTGKYLEASDLTNVQQQTQYALKDEDNTTTLVNPRTHTTAPKMVQQTITNDGATRNVTANDVSFTNDLGCFADFPDPGERQNVASVLVQGTLLTPTTVPNATICSPGGYGWLNFFDYKTCGPVSTSAAPNNTVAGAKTNAPIVGINVIHLAPPPDDPHSQGSTVVSVVTSDHPTPDVVPNVAIKDVAGSTTSFVNKRMLWREISPP